MFKIELEKNRSRFIPGQKIHGAVRGSAANESEDEELAVRLIWYTSGKGTRDFAIVDERRQEFSGARQVDFEFEFIAPRRPLSFSGQLISLAWAIEAVGLPSKRSSRIDIVLAHGANEIRLLNVTEDMKVLGASKPWLWIGNR